MSRPPFPISTQSTHLRLIRTESSQPVVATEEPVRLMRGEGYSQASLEANLDLKGAEPAIVGGYTMAPALGAVLPAGASDQLFCWDIEGSYQHRLARNEFQLLEATLDGPDIHSSSHLHWLTVQPRFRVRYNSSAHSACLGEIRLVDSQRFCVLENGEQIPLLDTQAAGASVLFLEHEHDQQIVRQQTQWQLQGEELEYRFDYRIQQWLPPELNAIPVRSLTVLEQYTSHFMERPLTADQDNTIWVPAMAPVIWGWSMRVERSDAGWQIARRKLVMPTVSHDAWVLPVWHANTLAYR